MYVSVLHVCVCIVCICLYCSGRHKNHRCVPKWPSPAAAPGGPHSGHPRSWAQTLFSSIPVPPDNPISRTPPLLPRRRSLNRPPRTAGWSTRPDPSLSTRSQAPSQPIGEVSSLPETYSVCHSPPKTPPDRDWRMHVCACMSMYLHVLHVYVCICMYCLYVCVFDWRKLIPSNFTKCQSHSWLSGRYWPMSLWRRVFESQNNLRSFAGIWFPFWQHIAGHQVLAWATFSLLRLEQNRKKNTYTYIQIQAYTSRFKQIHTYTRWY